MKKRTVVPVMSLVVLSAASVLLAGCGSKQEASKDDPKAGAVENVTTDPHYLNRSNRGGQPGSGGMSMSSGQPSSGGR